jgi:hypothetical protein
VSRPPVRGGATGGRLLSGDRRFSSRVAAAAIPAREHAFSNASRFLKNLERQRPVAERCRPRHRPTRRPRRSVRVNRLELHRVVYVRTHAPVDTASPDDRSDRHLATCRSPLDVAVREPEYQDRRCRDDPTVLVFALGLGYVPASGKDVASPALRFICSADLTWRVKTSSIWMLDTVHNAPRRQIRSSTVGASLPVKSYSKSPSGKRITNALLGMRTSLDAYGSPARGVRAANSANPDSPPRGHLLAGSIRTRFAPVSSQKPLGAAVLTQQHAAKLR